MICPACGHENRAGAKFCEECAAPLKRDCSSCGAELRPKAKFCDECGTAVASAGFSREGTTADARKVVTVVFADLAGSTTLQERVDAESARRLMERYYQTLRTVVEQHGGTVVKLLGDGVLAAFGVPQVTEDDAIRAVRAGVAMQEAFRFLAGKQGPALAEVGLRVAINTGEVVVSGGNDDVVGDPVNVAARLQQEGHDGEVVIGEATRRLVASLVTLEPLGSFTLRGRTEPVTAYRVVSLERPAGAAATPFVGRASELGRITSVYEATVATPAAHLVVLLGSPGLGKSRLIAELARKLGNSARVIAAQCDAAGEGTFTPLADALREFYGIDDATSGQALANAIETSLPEGSTETSRIANGVASLMTGAPGSPEETFFVVRRLLASLAAEKPVLLIIDDLQWAEPLLLDLVEHLVQWGTGVPLLVLVGARPELRDARSSLTVAGGLVADVITLGGLDAGAATQLAAHIIGASDLPAAVAAKVLATSEGNPLFVGELVRMLADEGVLAREGDRWVVGDGLASFEMPPTIHALLAARIERLRPEERTILERAAVVGRQFSRSAVAELLLEDTGDLDARLEALRRSELIERDTGWFLGEPVLRFHHVLIRDAAYRRLLKETRADLHGRFANWIETRVGESVEHDETIGWHLEQAHKLLGELGPLDEAGRAFGERAAKKLAAAGRRALARDDVSLAANLLERALARLDPADPARANLVLDACEALLAAGEVGAVSTVIEELGRLGEGSERLQAWHTCFVGQLTALTAPEALNETADSVAAAADRLALLGDKGGEAKAHFVHAQALARLGRVGACEAALDRALAAAREAGDRRRANAVLAGAPLAALWGPSPVTRASGRCLDVVRVLRITQGAPAVEAVALSCQGLLEALRGRTDAARRMIASSRKMVEELGITHRLLEVDVFAARVDLLEGETSSAERLLRSAYEGLRDLGLGIDAARAAALLARALLAEGRADDAEALSHESEKLAGDDLQAAISWRAVRAEALARRGETEAAIDLARGAVEIAATTDALLDHADARVALAVALRAAGRDTEAHAEERRAAELWETKGATRLLAERVRTGTGPAADAQEAPAAPPPEPGQTGRRLRPNAASVHAGRVEAAIRRRDLVAAEQLISEHIETVEHPTGATYGRQGQIDSIRRMVRLPDLDFRIEILATLGESHCLGRRRITAGGPSVGKFDVAEYEMDHLVISVVDDAGRLSRSEVFAADHLGDGIARLYELYAEQLPDGAARERALMTARAARTMLTDSTQHSMLDMTVPEIEFVDHRTVGYGAAYGADFISRWFDASNELTAGRSIRIDDVLALTPDGLVRRNTISGELRAGGGAFEIGGVRLNVFDPDGRISRVEVFEPNDEEKALARFDALTRAEAPAPAQRRVRPNAVTRSYEPFKVALAAHDAKALAETFAEDLVVVHHPSGATYGRRAMLATWRSMIKAERSSFRQEVLATLGDHLALERHLVTVEGLTESHVADFGTTEFDELSLIEVDDDGRWRHVEIFAPDHLFDAIARLYERYAGTLPAGPERDRAVATARAAGVNIVAEPEKAFAPSIEIIDRRLVGAGAFRGMEAALAFVSSMRDIARELQWRHDDVIALSPDRYLARVTNVGVARDGGGPFERNICVLRCFGADGRTTHAEIFEADHEAEALARFDELAAGTQPPPAFRLANEVWRKVQHGLDRWNARDWYGFENLFSPAARLDDRRRLNRIEVGAADLLVQFRMLFDQPESRWQCSLLATRGERLAIARNLYRADVDGGGPLEFPESLGVVDLGPDGRVVAIVIFDVEDEDAAYAELDRRYEAGEGREHSDSWTSLRDFNRGIASQDWDSLAALCADAFVEYDHRSLAILGTTRGRRAWAENFRALADLSPDTRYRTDHLRTCARGFYSHGGWRGTREGGPYDMPINVVIELDERGLIVRADVYDDDGVDTALARIAELTGSAEPARRFENLASRAWVEVSRALKNGDLEQLPAFAAPNYRFTDRTYVAQLELGADEWLEYVKDIVDSKVLRWEPELLATRGERLALGRSRIEVEKGDIGPSEFLSLFLTETDSDGRIVATVRFDADDIDAAYAELDRRWLAGEAKQHGKVAEFAHSIFERFRRRDWQAFAVCLAPQLRHQDHRLLGWGATLDDAATFLRSQQVLVELAPDVRYRTDHVRISGHVSLLQTAQVGTREGGKFESPLILVFGYDEEGRIAQMDVYDVDHVEEAWTRFKELAGPTASSLGRFANAASRLNERFMEAWAARDFDTIVAQHSKSAVYDDRRRLMRMATPRRESMKGTHFLLEQPGSGMTVMPIATRGERLVLSRASYEADGEQGGGPIAIDYLVVDELDDDGRFCHVTLFDPDDFDAAYEELDSRFDAAEGRKYGATVGWLRSFRAAMARRDWPGVARCYPATFLGHDHRLVGLGPISGCTSLVEMLRSMIELAPDARMRLDHLRISARAMITNGTWVGTRDGGAFESPFVSVSELDADGRPRRMDFYDPEQADRAFARFEEIDAATPADASISIVKPNAAAAAVRRWAQAYEVGLATGSWDGIREICAPDHEFYDRRRLVLLSGGRDLMTTSASVRAGDGARPQFQPTGTMGDRIALYRLLWSGGPPDGRFEIEYYAVTEVDESGLVSAFVLYDLEDVEEARCEALRRWCKIDAVAKPWVDLASELAAATNARDYGRLRQAYPAGLVVDDHRRAGIGRIEGADAYVETLRVLWDLAPDQQLELGRHWPAFDRHAAITTVRRWDKLESGGEFESDYLILWARDGDQVCIQEAFETDDLDKALARFEELRPLLPLATKC